MTDATTPSPKEQQQIEAARALGRSMWVAEMAESETERTAEARQEDWFTRRKKFIRMANRTLRRLQDKGFELTRIE
ncbi:MAG: hypothetical protein OER56_13180 [Hyphomicrobiales bacterium]|nr:hypothetical protein [Hyphomicrobiales bacterium]